MTTIDLNHDDDSDEATKDTCLLYLLGELDSEQAKRFERRLATSPRLETEILQQAEILTSLSEITLPITSSSLSVAPAKATSTPWKMIASLLAVSACIAAGVVGWWPRESADRNLAFTSVDNLTPQVSENAVSEVTLIARAWANDAMAFGGGNVVDLDFADLESAEEKSDDDTYDVADDTDDDSTLSWIYIAVSTISEGETDEG